MGTGKKVKYTGLVDQSVHKTVSELRTYRRRNESGNLAACFDVDETLLFWRSNSSEGSTSVNTEMFVAHLSLLKHNQAAIVINYQIFIITARPKTDAGLAYLVKQLRKLNYDLHAIPPGGIYMMNREYYDDTTRINGSSTGTFKSSARDHIQKKYNVQIIAMVGDQWSDVFKNGDNEEFLDTHNLSGQTSYIIRNADENVKIGLKLPDVHD